MYFTRKRLATSVIALACAAPAALTLSATASADPIPAPAPALPAMPNIPFLSGLTPANAPAMLQSLATMFTGAAATPAAATVPVAPVPAATASVTLPQPAAVPAAPLAAAVPATAAVPAALVPTAEVQLPQNPLNPVGLPPQLSFPGDLTSLLPAGMPLANLLPKSPAAVPAAVAAVPVAPALPAATTGLGELAPLMFPTSALP